MRLRTHGRQFPGVVISWPPTLRQGFNRFCSSKERLIFSGAKARWPLRQAQGGGGLDQHTVPSAGLFCRLGGCLRPFQLQQQSMRFAESGSLFQCAQDVAARLD